MSTALRTGCAARGLGVAQALALAPTAPTSPTAPTAPISPTAPTAPMAWLALMACAALPQAAWAQAPLRSAIPQATPAVPAALATNPNLAALPPGLLQQGLVLMQQAAQALAPPQARVLVTAGAPDSRLKLAPCSAGTVSLAPGVPAWGAARLAVRCTQGAPWSIVVPVRVQVLAPAVVAATALSPGTFLASGQLALADVDWAAHSPAPVARALAPGAPALFKTTGELNSRQLARGLTAGAPVRAADLQARQWFAAGAAVSVVAVGDGFSVVAEGQALSPGLEGQLVRVRTEAGRVVAGRATGERRVEVRL